jgi:DNA-binding SARP family transcriptional activator
MADLYLGDFLAEELYADWCAMEREYLRDQYITSMMRMVHCHEQMGNLPDAISTLYRVLKMDKYREDAYQKLMVLCASAGRKGEMIRAYTLCKKAIEQDLNMELSKVTTDLYAGLSRLKEDERRPNSAVLLHLVH